MKRHIEYAQDSIGPLFLDFNSRDGELKEGTRCYGSVRYHDLSVYTGPLIYKNGKVNKIGFGMQDFTSSSAFVLDEMGLDKTYKYDRYIGKFDYRKTDWIFGDGIMYFTDLKEKPKAFIKAFWVGLRPLRATDKLKTAELREGYTPDMEIFVDQVLPHKNRFNEIFEENKNVKDTDLLLIGDSWIEFYKKGPDNESTGSYLEDAKEKSVVNIGVGGTTFDDWVKNFEFMSSNLKFNRVLINLGYNDLHSFLTPKEIMASCQKLIAKILKTNSNAKIYINQVSYSPFFFAFNKQVDKLNNKLEKYCFKNKNNLIFLSTCSKFNVPSYTSEELSSYFVKDNIHLNEKGCSEWKKEIVKVF